MFESSILSYPERGPYGSQKYRGNCSGYLIRDLLSFLRPGLFCDPAEGSGTSGDVAQEVGVRYIGLDLKNGFDLLSDNLADNLLAMENELADLIFFHPPYWNMVRYSGSVWGKEIASNDLSHCKTYAEFKEMLHLALLNIYDAVKAKGHYAVLIGSMRKDGRYYDMGAAVQFLGIGKLREIIIKTQHNAKSSFKSYSNARNFVPIAHETLLIFQKDKVMSVVDYSIAMEKALQKRIEVTWRNLVRRTLQEIGGEAELATIYSHIQDSQKKASNVHWKAKVRQVLQQHTEFVRVERGVWSLN